MRRYLSLFSVLFVTLFSSHALVADAAAATDLKRTWTLYHSMDPKLGESGFTKRGVVTLEPEDNQAKVTVLNDEEGLSPEQFEKIMSSGWYQLKLVEDGPAKSVPTPVMTTVQACHLRRSNFRDEITLTFGQQGHVISMAYSPLVSPLAPKTCDELPAPSSKIVFNSDIGYEAAVPGMVLKLVLPNYSPPPGLKFITYKAKDSLGGGGGGASGGDGKPDGFGEGEEKEEPTGIMGFLHRYWYILVPMLIMNLMSAEAPAADQGAGGGGGGGNGGQTAGAAAAASSGGGGGGAGSKRRGKRG